MDCRHVHRESDEEAGCEVCTDCGVVLGESDISLDFRTSMYGPSGVYVTSKKSLPSPASLAKTRKAKSLTNKASKLNDRGVIETEEHEEEADEHGGHGMLAMGEDVGADEEAGDDGGGFGLGSERFFKHKGTPRNARERINRRMVDIGNKISQFPVALGMRASRDQVRHLFVRAMQLGKWRYGRSAEMVLGACLCIQARMSNIPVTMTTVANMVETDVYTLGSYFKKVKLLLGITLGEADPASYLEKYTTDLKLEVQVTRTLIDGARKLISLAQDHALFCGKNPEYVARAALCLITEIHLKTPFSRSVPAEMKKHAKLTIQQRYEELRSMLVKLGAGVPYLVGITNKNLIQHAEEILDFFWVLKARQLLLSPDDPPPSLGKEGAVEQQGGPEGGNSLFSPITIVSTPFTPHATPHPECPGPPTPGFKKPESYGASFSPPLKRKPLTKKEELARRHRSLPIGPSSFHHNLLKRQDWEVKVERAEKFLFAIFDELSVDSLEDEYGPLGEEELAIQRLLLCGKTASDLLAGSPKTIVELDLECEELVKGKGEEDSEGEEGEASQQGGRGNKKRKLDSTEVTEDDMPDEEASLYIRTKEEVSGRQTWDSMVEDHLKKAQKTT